MAAFIEACALGSELRSEEVQALVEVFGDTSRRWFFEGQGRSGLVAAMVAMRFMHLGRNAHFVGEATAPAVRKGDGLVLISGSGATPTSVSHGEVARHEGATVVTVTYSPDSPAARLADVVVYLPAKPSMQLGGSLFEQGALLVFDGVIASLAEVMGNAAAGLRARHSNLL
jgi:6-phospho-3-hexuloisomerase